MKKLLLAIVAVALFVVVGCQTCPKCPPETAIILVPPFGPVTIPESFFDDTDNWLPEKEFYEWMQKQNKEENKGPNI